MSTNALSNRRTRRQRALLATLVASGVVSLASAEARAAELIQCQGTEYDLRAMLEAGGEEEGGGAPLPENFTIESGSLDDGSIRVAHGAFAAVFPDGLPFFGLRTEIYANNNGNITFGESMTSYTPDAIPGLWQPTIAPWFGDVDFRTQSGTWKMCVDPAQKHVLFTWNEVGYFSGHDDKRNSFQIVLVDADETCSEARNFDMEFRYAKLEWTTGDASGGEGGLGGVPAVAGIDAGDGEHAVALPDSGTGAVLGLVGASNVGEPGIFRFYLTEHGLPTCGDGIVDECEACDDGNDDNTDACTNLCQPATCGDGFVWAGEEACDGPSDDLVCPEGSEGKPVCNDACGIDNGDCVSPDPCADAGCSENAMCISPTPSTAFCVCNAGYEGNGIACTDIDECGAIQSPCDANASCTNTAGGFACECGPGFEGSGVDCIDVDECDTEQDLCGANAKCANQPGGFFCTCDEGFRRVEDVCLDIDECGEGSDDCDPNATCTNVDGAFECRCPEGFVGDGRLCLRDIGGEGGGSGEGGSGGSSGEGGSGNGGSGQGGSGGSGGEGGSGGTGTGAGGEGGGSGTGGNTKPKPPTSKGSLGVDLESPAEAAPPAVDPPSRVPGPKTKPPSGKPQPAAPAEDSDDDAKASDEDGDANDKDDLEAGGTGLLCAAGQGGSDPSALATLMAVFALLGARRKRS